MIKILITSIVSLIVLTSFMEVTAQEDISLLLGKDVKDWHAIGAALISEGRHEESIKYYDRILEINPEDQRAMLNKGSVLLELDRYDDAIKEYNRILEINPENVKALVSKGMVLNHLLQFDEALFLIDKAAAIEPDNKIVREKKANFLSGAMTVPAHNSIYDINLRVTVRDSSGSLISVFESTNSRYLPYDITEKVFAETFDSRGTVVNDGRVYEIVQKKDTFQTMENAMALFSIYRISEGFIIDVFEAFTPMSFLEKDDTLTAEWTIKKDIT